MSLSRCRGNPDLPEPGVVGGGQYMQIPSSRDDYGERVSGEERHRARSPGEGVGGAM